MHWKMLQTKMLSIILNGSSNAWWIPIKKDNRIKRYNSSVFFYLQFTANKIKNWHQWQRKTTQISQWMEKTKRNLKSKMKTKTKIANKQKTKEKNVESVAYQLSSWKWWQYDAGIIAATYNNSVIHSRSNANYSRNMFPETKFVACYCSK